MTTCAVFLAFLAEMKAVVPWKALLALNDWAYRRGVKLDYTRPGKPTDNGLIESFNGRLRDEFLNVNEFITMPDVREKLTAWQYDYNHRRPHGSLGHLTPSEFATMRSGQPKEAANL